MKIRWSYLLRRARASIHHRGNAICLSKERHISNLYIRNDGLIIDAKGRRIARLGLGRVLNPIQKRSRLRIVATTLCQKRTVKDGGWHVYP